MEEYKEGDLVVINERTHSEHDYRFCFTDGMANASGCICIITQKLDCISKKDADELDDDGYEYKLAFRDDEDKKRINCDVRSFNWASSMFTKYNQIESFFKNKHNYKLNFKI